MRSIVTTTTRLKQIPLLLASVVVLPELSITFTFSFSRRFYPKQLTNVDNRSNQNQQNSSAILNKSAMTLCIRISFSFIAIM